jgi:hypothetical protein
MTGLIRSSPIQLVSLHKAFKINCMRLHDETIRETGAQAITIHLQPGRVVNGKFMAEGIATQVPKVDCPLSNYFLTGIPDHALRITYTVNHVNGEDKVSRFELLLEQTELLDLEMERFAHNKTKVQEFEIVKTILWSLYDGITMPKLEEQIETIALNRELFTSKETD